MQYRPPAIQKICDLAVAGHIAEGSTGTHFHDIVRYCDVVFQLPFGDESFSAIAPKVTVEISGKSQTGDVVNCDIERSFNDGIQSAVGKIAFLEDVIQIAFRFRQFAKACWIEVRFSE